MTSRRSECAAAKSLSIDAVRHFKLALEEFQSRSAGGQSPNSCWKCARGVDWIEHDRTRYWPRAMQQASDAVIEARNNLERAELSLRPEDKRSCYEQKMRSEKAKRRLRLTEEKVRASAAGASRCIARPTISMGGSPSWQIPWTWTCPALAALERMAVALDRYTERSAPVESPGGVETASPAPAGPPPASDGELQGDAL